MTLPPLEELKRLQAEATPGPWAVNIDPDDADMTFIYDELGRLCLSFNPIGEGSAYCPADLELAALSPALLAEVIRLTEALTTLQDLAAVWTDQSALDDFEAGQQDAAKRIHQHITRILGEHK